VTRPQQTAAGKKLSVHSARDGKWIKEKISFGEAIDLKTGDDKCQRGKIFRAAKVCGNHTNSAAWKENGRHTFEHVVRLRQALVSSENSEEGELDAQKFFGILAKFGDERTHVSGEIGKVVIELRVGK
jgi:hypothetical protein